MMIPDISDDMKNALLCLLIAYVRYIDNLNISLQGTNTHLPQLTEYSLSQGNRACGAGDLSRETFTHLRT